jgi:hypothetical protein
MHNNKSVQRFFAYVLLAVGGLVAVLCGGCTLLFLALALNCSVRNVAVFMTIAALIFGALPTAVGVGLFLIGREMEWRAEASRKRTVVRPLSLSE